MAYCPFSLVKEVVKERKVGKAGQVVEEKESPTYHLLECLKEKCEVYDLAAQKCALPILANRLQSIEEVEGKTRQATSDLNEATSALLSDLLESSSGILSESKGTKELVTKLLAASPAPSGGGGGPGEVSAGLTESLRELVASLEESHHASVETAMETRVFLEKITQALTDVKAAQGGAGLDDESKATLREIKDILHENSRGMDHVFSLLPEVMKESQQPLATFAESNRAALTDVKDALDRYQESLQEGLQDLSAATKDSLETSRESRKKEAESLKEFLATLASSMDEAQKSHAEDLSETLKSNSGTLTQSLKELPQRLSTAQEPLFSRFAEENKSAFDLFVQGATETTLSLAQLRQTSEKSNVILEGIAAATSDALDRNIQTLGRLSEAVKVSGEESARKTSETLGDLAGAIKTSQAEASATLVQKLDALGENLKGNQDSLSSLLLESAEKSQTSLESLTQSNDQALEVLADLKASLLEAHKESAVGTAEVVKRLQADSRAAQEEMSASLGAAFSEGLSRSTKERTDHADKLREAQAQHQENLFAALAGSMGDALRLNSEIVSSSMEKAEKTANEKRSAVQAGLAENRQALEKLLSATEESTRPLNATLQEVGGKLDALLSTLERQNVLQSDSFETLGQRVTGLRDDERRSTEALLAALAENQRAQAQALDSLRAALEKSLETTREAMAGPKEREVALDNISKDIAASTQSLGAFLETQRKLHEEETRKFKSEEARLHNDRGVSLYYQQAYGAAEMEFKRTLELAPDMTEAYNNLALVLTEAGKHEEAATCFQRAIELSPDFAEALNNLGCLYERMGEHARAVETFTQALSKRQDYAGAYANLGTAYHALNKLDEAAKAWEKALTLDPANEKVKKKLHLLRGA